MRGTRYVVFDIVAQMELNSLGRHFGTSRIIFFVLRLDKADGAVFL